MASKPVNQDTTESETPNLNTSSVRGSVDTSTAGAGDRAARDSVSGRLEAITGAAAASADDDADLDEEEPDDEEEDELDDEDDEELDEEEDEDDEDLDEEDDDEDLDDEEDEEDEEDSEFARQSNELKASTEEEVDALRVNLEQDADRGFLRDSTGLIVDDVAREHISAFTEVGPEVDDRGARSVVPGRDDTSAVLRKHHPNTNVARAQDVVEGNLDEPSDETRAESKVDEGTAA